MRTYHWVAISVAGALLAASAAAVLGSQGSAEPDVRGPAVANSPSPSPVRESQLRPAAPAPTTPAPGAGPAAPTSPQRVETITYDAWVVTCQDTVSSTTKKRCLASLRVMSRNQNQRQMLLNWQIGANKDGHYVTAFHIPPGVAVKKDDQMVGGGILIQKGVELKFGNGPVRLLSYVSCDPQQCFAEALIDDAFVKEAIANTKATITVSTVGGGPIPFELSIKGIDKAISSTRK